MLPAPRFEILEHVRSHEKFDIGAPRMPSAARIPLTKKKYRPWRQGELLGFRDDVYGLLLRGSHIVGLTKRLGGASHLLVTCSSLAVIRK
jgi:hypothetical protein